MTTKKGLLLINLGTPDSPAVKDVRKYLGEFLMDPKVVDIPFIARWLLVHGIILRTRPKKSAHAYQKIWTDRGSPLHFHLVDLGKQVAEYLPNTSVKIAMRYQSPSIETALREFQNENISDLDVVPLFPQYATASTGSCKEEVSRVAKKLGLNQSIRFMPAFYDQDFYLDAFALKVRQSIEAFNPDTLLFSYHGLPERQLKRESDFCLSQPHCCETPKTECYRAQSLQTTAQIVKRLGTTLPALTAFQSRLGRTVWISPYTDVVLKLLAQQKKRVLVISPSFVADCLETLEEIAIREREAFLKSGGKDLMLCPSLNSDPIWAQGLAQAFSR